MEGWDYWFWMFLKGVVLWAVWDLRKLAHQAVKMEQPQSLEQLLNGLEKVKKLAEGFAQPVSQAGTPEK